MTNQHTPGPWRKAEAATTIPIKAANGKTVATIRYRENDNIDADLIAASPELLEALEAIVKHQPNLSDWLRKVADAAIVKATGRD